MKPGDRVAAGPDCPTAPWEPYVEAWINEGEQGTVLRTLDYVEYAEARPMEVGSPGEHLLHSGNRPPHERRRYTRLLVRFDFGLTIRVDEDLVTPLEPDTQTSQ